MLNLAATALATLAIGGAPSGELGFYNYGAVPFGERPGIGRFVRQGERYDRDGVVLEASDVPWIGDRGWIKSPSAVRNGNRIHLYFATYDGQQWAGVGLATTNLFGRDVKVVGRVIDRKPTMGPSGTEFPRVIRDPQAPPAERWKMWMSADPDIAYATSADGIRWLYRGEFDLPPTDFNQGQRNAGTVLRTSGGRWLMFSFERAADGRWTTDTLHAPSPMGPWQRSSDEPALPPRRIEQPILEAGRQTIRLPAPAPFAAGEPVYLLDPVAQRSQLNQVVAARGDTVELRRPVDHPYRVARTWAWNSYLTHVWVRDGRWRGLGTAFHADGPREHTLLAAPVDPCRPLGRWQAVTAGEVSGMPLWPGSWFGSPGPDHSSIENPVLVQDAENPADETLVPPSCRQRTEP